jgi:hypothetical protein
VILTQAITQFKASLASINAILHKPNFAKAKLN